ncbi:MAG: FAD binding domain-containing protein [Chloroflexi bacterium]|nr:FAD binding domain-containing protein [Chloroflexota bacterium]
MPMFLPRFTIDQPSTLGEASRLLREYGEDGCVYAGGTELLLAMKKGGLRYGHLVDIKTVPGLDAVAQQDGAVRIGALATHMALERSSLVRSKLPIFAQVEARVANPRVRASGTLGGNLCFGEPHSDPATLLLCLEPTLRVTGADGSREVPLPVFMVGPYEVALEPGELLESVTVPLLGAHQRAAYRKFQLHEYPMLGLALVLDLDQRGAVTTSARVAIGSVSPTPRRSEAAEALLVGERGAVRGRLDEAANALADDADLLDDHEGSAEYKRHLIGVFLKQAFEEATADTSAASGGRGS